MPEATTPPDRHTTRRAASRRSARWGRRRLQRAHLGWPLALALGSSLAGPAFAQNLPQGGTVTGGSGTIQQIDANLLQIQQNTQNMSIDWQSFNVGPSGIVRFLQPSSSSIALNRVIGNDPSAIYGQIQANGQVILLNPKGIYFGPNSSVDVNALVATTANIRNDDFMAGRLHFEQGSGDPDARVVNAGLVSVAQGGFAILAAAGVQNTGRIVANGGTVVLAGTKTFTVDFHGDGLLSFAATGTVEQAPSGASALVDNSGIVEAAGGRVLMTARAARDVLANVINTTGIVVAHTAQMVNGEIVIDGGDNGIVNVGGTLDASGRGAGETGGTVKVLGESVRLAAGAAIDAAGDAGGGTVLVGGNYQGQGPERTARIAYMDAAAVIDASALTSGNGGKVILWADDTASMAGTISARGGALSGNGGFVETSGKNRISIADTTRVYTTGATGNAGNWLIDPTDFTIAFSGGDMTGAALIINLGLGNVTIQSNSGGSGTSGTIFVNDAIINTALGARTLTLDAVGGIEINSAISSTLNPLNLNLWAGSDIVIAANISTNGGNVTTNGTGGAGQAGGVFSNSYALDVGSGNITLNQAFGISMPGSILTSTGTVTFNSDGNVTNAAGGYITGPANLVVAGTGNVTLNSASNAISNITLNRTGTAGNISIVSSISPNIQTSTLGTGTFSITGVGFVQSGTITQDGGGGAVTINGGTGSVTLGQANTFTGALTVTSDLISATAAQTLSSALTLQPYTASTNVIFNGSGGGLQLTAATLGNFSGYTSLTAGSSTAGTLTVSSAFAAPANVDVNLLSGGAMSVSGNLTTSGTGSIDLRSAANVVVSGDLTTGGGDIYVTGNVASWAGPFDSNTPVYGSTAGAFNGVSITGGVTLDAGGGDISIAGKGGDSGANLHGVLQAASSVIGTSGAGKITIAGLGGSPAGGNNHIGIEIGGSITAAGTGGIKLTGTGGAATGASNQSHGIYVLATGFVSGGAADVTMTGVGGSMAGSGNTNYGIQMLGQVQTTTGNITMTGTGSGSSGGTNFGVAISGGADVQTTGTGSITLTGYGGSAAGGLDHGVAISGTGTNVGKTGTGAGTVSITGVGGMAGGTNAGIYLDNNASIASYDGALTLDGSGGGDGTSTTNHGTIIDTGATLLSTSGAITVVGIGGGSSGNGNHGIILSAGGDIVSANGNISLAANASGTGNNDAIHIDNSSIRSTAAANITLRAATYGTAGTGIRFAGALAQLGETTMTGDLTLRADAMATSATSLVFAHTAASGTVTFRTESDATTIGVNGGSGTLAIAGGLLTAADGSNFNTLKFGSATQNSAIQIDTTAFSQNVVFQTLDAVYSNGMSFGTKNLTIDAGGTYTQGGGISTSGLVTFQGTGGVTATDPGNSFTNVLINKTGAAAVSITTTGVLDLSTSTLATGALSLTAAGVTQSGALTTAGSIFVNAGANAIALGNASNAISGNVRFFNSGANDVTFANGVATSFGGGTTTVGGNLSVTTTGAMTQASALSVAGNATFNAGGNAITLNNAANAVTGNAAFTNAADTVTWREAAAVSLAASSSAALSVQAGGAITQAGALTVAGAASFNAGANAITLTDASNALSGSVTLINTGANNVQLTNAGAIGLNGSSVGGNLTLIKTGAGDITQSTPLTVGGTLSADAGSGLVTLNQGANSITGAVSLSSTNVGTSTIQNGGPLVLGTVNLTGNLDAIGNSGAITQSGVITTGGDATFTTGGYAITLANASNAVGGSVSLNNTGANAVSWQEAGAVSLAASGVGGDLTVTAGGALTQAGALTVGGNAVFAAGANSITLTHASNAVAGAVGFSNTGANAVSWNEAAAVALGVSTIGGTYTVTAGGAITQTGDQTVAGASSFTTGANNITLDSFGNNFTGAVDLSNTGATATTDLWAGSSLVLGTINVAGGALTLKNSGAPNITQTGSITQAAGGGAVMIQAITGDTALSQANSFSGDVTVAGLTGSITANQTVTGAGKYFVFGPTTSASLGANITTNNGQIGFQPDTTLTANATLNAGSGDIYFSNTLDGAYALTATTTGSVDFFGAVGGTTALTNLTVSAGTGVSLQGDVTTTGAQSYAGAGTAGFAGGAVVLTGNSISFANALSDGAASVTLDAGAGVLAFGGAVTLASVNALATGGITLAGNVTATTGPISFGSAFSTTGSSTISSPSGGMTLAGGSWTSGTVSLAAPFIDLTGSYTSTGGAFSAVADVGVSLATATITTNGGNITLSGNAGGAAGGDFSGVELVSSTIGAGGGNISMIGIGGDGNGSAGYQHGIVIQNTAVTTTGTGTISLAGTSGDTNGNINVGVYVYGASSNVQTVNGAITVNGTGGTGPGTNNPGVSVELGAIHSTGTGSVTVIGVGGLDGHGVIVSGSTGAILTANGALSITGTGGGGTAAGINGIVVTDVGSGSGSIGSTGSGTVNLAGTGGSSSGLNNAGIRIAESGAMVFSSSGSLTLTGTGGSGGNDFNNGIEIINAGAVSTAGGAMSLDGNAGGGTNASGIVLQSAATITTTGGGNVALDGNGTTNMGLVGNAANTITSSGTVTLVSNNGIAFNTVDIITPGAFSATSGAANVQLGGPANAVGGTVTITASGGGDADFSNTIATQLGATNISGSLFIVSGGAITQTAATLNVGGDADFEAASGAITLNNATNNVVGSVALLTGAGNASFAASGGVVLGISNVTGNLAVTAAGDVTQIDTLTVSGTTSVTAGANQVLLNDPANALTGAVTVSNSGANDVTVTTVGDLVLGNLAVGSGNLTVIAGAGAPGGITQTGTIVQEAGAASAAFTSDGGITLTGSNTLTGPLSVLVGATGGLVTLNNTVATDIGGVGGPGLNSFSLTSGGAVSQSGPINTLAGDLYVMATGNINLNSPGNSVTGGNLVLTANGGGNAIYSGTGNLTLGATTVGGNLNVSTTGGNIGQSTGVTVAGTTDLTTITSGAITLNQANSFGGAVTLTSAGALNVSAIQTVSTNWFTATAAGAITFGSGGGITTTGGAIDLTATANVAMNTSSLSSNGGNITIVAGPGGFTGAELLATSINAGGGDISITGQGQASGNSQHGIWIGGGTNITTTGAGDITLTGTGGAAGGGGNIGVFLYNGGAVQAQNGTVTVIGQGAGGGGSNHGVAFNLGGQITSTGGAIFVTGTGSTGAGGGDGVWIDGTGSKIESVSGNITVTGTGATSGAGNDGVRIANAGYIGTTSGTIGVTGDAGGSAGIGIALADGVATGGVVSQGAGTIGLVGTGTGGLAGIGSSGTISIIGGGSATGGITLQTDEIDLASGAAIQTAGMLTIDTITPGLSIGINNAGSALNIDGATFANVSAGMVRIGGASATGQITIGADATNSYGENFIFENGAGAPGVAFNGAFYTSGDLTVMTAGTITQTAAIAVDGMAGFVADGNIVLGNAANAMAGGIGFSSTGGNVTIANTGPTDFHMSDASGTLDVSVTTGTVSQLGAITTGGAVTVASQGAILWNNASNAFGGPLNVTTTAGADATFFNTSATTFGTVSVDGDLSVTSGGTIAQGGTPLAVVGTSSFQSVGNTTLANATNSFGGAVSLTTTAGGHAGIAATGQLILGTSTIAGNFAASVGSPMTQTGALAVAGTADFAATNGPLTLTNSSNTFGGMVSLTNSGNFAVGIAASGLLTLGDVSMTGGSTGGFTATASNGIAQSGGTTIQAGAGPTVLAGGGGTVVLGEAGNAFGNTVSLSGTGGTLAGTVNSQSGAAAAPFVTATGGIFDINGTTVGSAPVTPPSTGTQAVLNEIAAVAPIDSATRVVDTASTDSSGLDSPAIDSTLGASTGDLAGDTGGSGTEESQPSTVAGSAPPSGQSAGSPPPTGPTGDAGGPPPPSIVVSGDAGTGGSTANDVNANPAPQPGPVTLVPGVLTSMPGTPTVSGGGVPGISDPMPQQGNPSNW